MRQTMDGLRIDDERKSEEGFTVSVVTAAHCPAKLPDILYINVPRVKLWAGLAF